MTKSYVKPYVNEYGINTLHSAFAGKAFKHPADEKDTHMPYYRVLGVSNLEGDNIVMMRIDDGGTPKVKSLQSILSDVRLPQFDKPRVAKPKN